MTSKGFSLLEMVIVLGIIAVILGLSIGMMTGMQDTAKYVAVDADMQKFTSKLEAYKMNAGSYPSQAQGLEALVNKPSSSPVPRRWVQLLTSIPKDPWDGDYVYKYPSSKDPRSYEIISKGPDGVEGGGDDISSLDKK